VLVQQVTACTVCGGRGIIIDDPCPYCKGTGDVTRAEKVKVSIPPGIDEGTTLRIPRHGMRAPEAGGVPGDAYVGDAYVIVQSTADPRFERRGADLWHVEEIEVADAVLGTSRIVPTLDGEVSVDVSPGTQPGTVMRLAGKGLPHSNGTERGDLCVAIAVRVPQILTDRQRQVWEALRNDAAHRD
jgi:molecular chaperone DnaJ